MLFYGNRLPTKRSIQDEFSGSCSVCIIPNVATRSFAWVYPNEGQKRCLRRGSRTSMHYAACATVPSYVSCAFKVQQASGSVRASYTTWATTSSLREWYYHLVLSPQHFCRKVSDSPTDARTRNRCHYLPHSTLRCLSRYRIRHGLDTGVLLHSVARWEGLSNA
jgi:hypothetical protein